MERNGEQKKPDLKTKLPTQKTVFPTIRAKRANHPLRQARPNDPFSGAAALA
jgi:hypothetical protein